MAYDVTQDAQYIAVKGAYDLQINNATDVENTYKEYNDAKQKLAYLTPDDPAYAGLKQTVDDDTTKLNAIDPSGALRKAIDGGGDPVADLTQKETEALGALGTFLIDQNDIDTANGAALSAFDSGAVTGKEDVLTRAMAVMATMSDAAGTVADHYMDQIDANSAKANSISDMVAKLRSQRPSGDPTTPCTVDPETISTLKALGVSLPASATPDPTTGVITVTLGDIDTMSGNAQSAASNLININQDNQVKLSKAINVVQAMDQGQVSENDKVAQLAQKIFS
jgi:hypothetical protein